MPGPYQESILQAEEWMALARQSHNSSRLGLAAIAFVTIYVWVWDFEKAIASGRQGLGYIRQSQEPNNLAHMLCLPGYAEGHFGNLSEARQILEYFQKLACFPLVE